MSKNAEWMKESYSFEELKQIVRILRAPDGCPWDRAQTHESMEDCMLEESAEVIQAVRNKDRENLCEELGDVLLQVLMHSDIAEENKEFTFEDVVNGLAAKLVRRHPNVFYHEDREEVQLSREEGLRRWEAVKAEEKKKQGNREGNELRRIPAALPAIYFARKVLKKASKIYGEENIADKDIMEIEQLIEKCDIAQKDLTKRIETFINDMEKKVEFGGL